MLQNMMVKEWVDSNSDLLKSFCGMYDLDEDNDEHDNQHHYGSSSDNEAVTDGANIEAIAAVNNSINDDAAEHVCHVEVEVFHHVQVVACHWNANRYVYNSIIEHEQLCIALLLQMTCILQQQWQQLYDADEHHCLQQAITDKLNKACSN